MGFWDARLSDLEAKGVQFTDEEVEILERGGRVLHLHPMESAEADDYYSLAERYPNGEVVLTLEVISAVSPFDRYNAAWKPKSETVRDLMDDIQGRSRWTQRPVYIGYLDTETPKGIAMSFDHLYVDYRSDDLQPYVWWNCLPYDPSMDHAIAVLYEAQANRHNDSMWDSYHWMNDMFRNFMDPTDCWLYIHHHDLLQTADLEHILEVVECEWGGATTTTTEDVIQNIANEMDDFFRLGVIPFTDGLEINGVPIPHPYPGVVPTHRLPWKPLEEYIPFYEVDALSLWKRMNARRNLGLAVDRHLDYQASKEDIE